MQGKALHISESEKWTWNLAATEQTVDMVDECAVDSKQQQRGYVRELSMYTYSISHTIYRYPSPPIPPFQLDREKERSWEAQMRAKEGVLISRVCTIHIISCIVLNLVIL